MAVFVSKFRNFSCFDAKGRISFVANGAGSFYKTKNEEEVVRLKERSNFGKDYFLSEEGTVAVKPKPIDD